MLVSSPRMPHAATTRWHKVRFWAAALLVLTCVALASTDAEAQTFAPRPDPELVRNWRPIRNWVSTHDQREETVPTVIQTDRPSFTAAHTLVPKGWAQLESGYQFTYNRNGSLLTNTNGAPELNLRVGVAEWLEWRTLWAGVVGIAGHDTAFGTHRYLTSSANLQTGFKIKVSEQAVWIPQSALITTVFLPTGYGPTSVNTVAPQIDYIYGWDLFGPWSLTGSTGAVLPRRGNVGSNEWFQSVVVGQEWSDQLSSYGEWYVVYEDGANQKSTAYTMDSGILWRPLPNIQFDWRAGFGLNSAADNFFTGVGFSARY